MAKYKIIPSSRTIVQSPISIGHKAEKGVEAIEFDLTAWVETYGSGTLTVIMRRWGDAIPYPIALEIDENNKATWTLSDIDTAKAGMAYAQLNYIVGDEVVKKSDIYTFRVMDSLTGEGEPPEAYESWLEHLTHFAAEAMAEVLDIEGIVTDKTLAVDGGIADAKAAGDALALKADKSTTYTKTEVDQMIEDVEVETDTTLTISGAPADAKATGDALSALEDQFTEETDQLKADLTALSKMQPHVYDLTWEQGGIDSTGAEYYQDTHIRSNSIDVSDFDNVKVVYPAGYRGYICTISNGVFNRSSIAAGATANLDITNVQSMRFDVTNGNPISVDIGDGVVVSSVCGIVNYINSLNDNIADNITDLYSATSESGKFINGNNGNIGSDPTYSIRSIDCANQTKLIINPNFTHTSLGYGFYDDSNTVKGYGKFTAPIGTYYVIDVPSGATKFTFTTTLNAVPHPLVKAFEDMNDVKQQIDALKVDTSNPLANTGLVPPSFITMFKKIVHIGDSLTRGQTDTTSPTASGADIPNYSRPVMMGRMIGNENLNLGLGGRTASMQYMNSAGYSKGWYINATGGTAYTEIFTPADFLENPGDCYIIALGTNDISAGGFTGDVSMDINDADFTQNANTSVGGYAMIIQQIKAIQPKAKIFCVTIPHSRNTNAVALRTEANQKIADIVNHFDNCYLIDLYTYAEQSADGEFATYYKNATHNNCLGYMKRAQQYIAYIDWIILNNLSDFRNVNFIGTNYDYVP